MSNENMVQQAREGMSVQTADGQKLGKVKQVWFGIDPTASDPRCDEDICSRLEVHQGFLKHTVMYIPSNAIANVDSGHIVLNVDMSAVGEHDWLKQPHWIAAARAGIQADRS